MTGYVAEECMKSLISRDGAAVLHNPPPPNQKACPERGGVVDVIILSPTLSATTSKGDSELLSLPFKHVVRQRMFGTILSEQALNNYDAMHKRTSQYELFYQYVTTDIESRKEKLRNNKNLMFPISEDQFGMYVTLYVSLTMLAVRTSPNPHVLNGNEIDAIYQLIIKDLERMIRRFHYDKRALETGVAYTFAPSGMPSDHVKQIIDEVNHNVSNLFLSGLVSGTYNNMSNDTRFVIDQVNSLYNGSLINVSLLHGFDIYEVGEYYGFVRGVVYSYVIRYSK